MQRNADIGLPWKLLTDSTFLSAEMPVRQHKPLFAKLSSFIQEFACEDKRFA
jgi:hypothetical protein